MEDQEGDNGCTEHSREEVMHAHDERIGTVLMKVLRLPEANG